MSRFLLAVLIVRERISRALILRAAGDRAEHLRAAGRLNGQIEEMQKDRNDLVARISVAKAARERAAAIASAVDPLSRGWKMAGGLKPAPTSPRPRAPAGQGARA